MRYLITALELPDGASHIYEIGGADVVTYRDMMLRYATIRSNAASSSCPSSRRGFLLIGFTSSRRFQRRSLAQPVILGLNNEVIVRDPAAARDFPEVLPVGFDTAVQRALDRYRTVGPETTWFDAFDVRKLPPNFNGVREGMLVDRRERMTEATPS